MPPDVPPSPFSHLSPAGDAAMVDVSAKSPTRRTAAASAVVTVGADVLARLGSLPKGDALATARLAGIMAAKRTSDLIPLCHGVSPEHVEVLIEPAPPAALRILATVSIVAKTGVEMEALTAASVAALTIYDMCKSISKAIEIGPIRLESKTGGKSGDYRR